MDHYNYLNISISPDTSALDLFVAGTDEVYVIAPVVRGWRFCRVTRRGTVSVTVADGRILSGSRILDALRIAAACPGGGPDFFQALAAAEIPVAPFRAPDWMLPSSATLDDGAGTAIRSFLAGRDIERMLSFPFVTSPEGVAATILAPATAPLRPAAETDASIFRLTDPIDRRYAVIYPEGVTPSSRDVAYNDTLTLTYHVDGKKDAEHHLTVGKPSPFVEYDGAAIKVRPLSALGITLEPLDPPAQAPAPKPQTPPAEDDTAKEAETPAGSRVVTLVMRFADDRVVRSDITLARDSAEYSLLRAGMFHGHRARRLVVRHHGDESYLIDLRHPDEDAATDATAAPAATEPQEPDEPRRHHRRRSSSPWLFLILAIVAIGLGIVAVSYLPGLFEHVDSYDAITSTPAPTPEALFNAPPADSAPADSTDAGILATDAAPEPEDADSADPAEDYAYLNRAEIWSRDSLATDTGLEIFDIFSTGDLAAIPAHDFFASGICSNALVNKTVRLIWQAKGSQTQTGNERALRKLSGQASIDFNALFNELAGIRPSNPNNRPLPSNNQ